MCTSSCAVYNVSVGMIGAVYFLEHYYNYALGPFVDGPLMYSLVLDLDM